MRPLRLDDPPRLGPYQLFAVVGAGGMGQVYLGQDAAGQVAAVKVLRAELLHEREMVRRFAREAATAQAVRGAGVARVLEVSGELGQPWIATEFLAGPTLFEAVARHGALDESAVRTLGAALAHTLGDIHRAGLVHRDLKPSNIVLTADGPRVIDFGIARPEHGLTLTGTGQTPTTPGYAPPEQILGRRTGPAADVFALGAVLVYAATGRRAYEGGHVAAVHYRVVHGSPDLDGLPEPLRAPVAHCLTRNAAQRPEPAQLAAQLTAPLGRPRRYGARRTPGGRTPGRRSPAGDPFWTAEPLATDIADRVTAVRQLTGEPAPAGEPTTGGPTRRRLVAALAGGSTALVAGAAGGAWWLLRDGRGQDPGPHSWAAEPLSTYLPGVAPATLWSQVGADGQARAAPLPTRNLVLVVTGNGGLAAHRVSDGQRGWRAPGARIVGRPQTAGELVLILSAATETDRVAKVPEGRLTALDPASGERRWTAATAAALLATDRERAYLLSGEGRLSAVDLASRREVWSAQPPVGASARRPPAAVAGGDRLVVYGTDGRVAALESRTGQVAWHRADLGGTALPPALDGDTVVLGGTDLLALRLTDGEQLWSRPPAGTTGWGAPTVRGEAIFAVDDADLRRCRTRDGDGVWTIQLDVEPLPLAAPVVEGNSVWTVLHGSGSAGVSVTRADNGIHAWPYARGGPGRWEVSAAGNRVFLLHEDFLVAMPVC